MRIRHQQDVVRTQNKIAESDQKKANLEFYQRIFKTITIASGVILCCSIMLHNETLAAISTPACLISFAMYVKLGISMSNEKKASSDARSDLIQSLLRKTTEIQQSNAATREELNELKQLPGLRRQLDSFTARNVTKPNIGS